LLKLFEVSIRQCRSTLFSLTITCSSFSIDHRLHQATTVNQVQRTCIFFCRPSHL